MPSTSDRNEIGVEFCVTKLNITLFTTIQLDSPPPFRHSFPMIVQLIIYHFNDEIDNVNYFFLSSQCVRKRKLFQINFKLLSPFHL